MSVAKAAVRPHRLTSLIVIALILGIAVGFICNSLAPTPEAANDIASWFSIITDIFLRMIKMIVAPLVFATIAAGIASIGSDGATLGRIAGKAMAWFIVASLSSLALGMVFTNLVAPGEGLALPLPTSPAGGAQAAGLNLRDFLTHIFPASAVQAMASNEVLQILVFSVFFGVALSKLRSSHAKTMATMVDELVHVMLRITDFVMNFAPLGVFGAMAAVITTHGLGVLVTYGKYIGAFYLSLATLWALLLAAGALFLGRAIFRLLGLLRQPMLLAFSTASSEAAFPSMIEQLMRFGVKERVASLVLPLGYSFNLDGSMMYMTFAALFIAQAYGIELSFAEQVTLLLVMLVTSKGIAGVPRASLVVVAATLPMFDLPASGMLLLIGIDQFLDMGRTVTNVLGNGIATAVVAKWEGEFAEVEEAG